MTGTGEILIPVAWHTRQFILVQVDWHRLVPENWSACMALRPTTRQCVDIWRMEFPIALFVRHPSETECALAIIASIVVMLSLKRRGGGITFHVVCSCDLDLDPMTFICELNPLIVEICRMCKYELRTSTLSKVIVWQTYKQKDTTKVFPVSCFVLLPFFDGE